MAKVYIDNREFEADERDNLLQVALSKGFDLPYFCWHPCLDSVGACRQCAVKQFKDENDTDGHIVMACMTPAAEGSRIAVDDAEARDFRARVIEWLMINHPHDCPVCEEGGECHLQDMTLMTGHTRRRYRGTKRTHRNQDLGPFISHEMNRCIACYRCVRYYRDYAGGDDLEAFAAHDHVYFGRHADGALENPFSGNLVEVCPTGVFTDKTLGAHYTRKWDLQAAPSICTHCSLGCNTSPGERKGVLKRIQNRYHGEINGYFLCDRGRFGAGFVNRGDRPRTPLLRDGGGLRAAGEDEALDRIREMLASANGVVGIGSPRASLEGNYALRRLVGADHYAAGFGARERVLTERALDILRDGPAGIATLREVESCDAVLVLGEDPTHTAPRLALALRQTARNAAFEIAAAKHIPRWHDRAVRDVAGDAASPLHIVHNAGTDLDDIAARHAADPDGVARLGFAVAHAIDDFAPEPEDLDAATRETAKAIAADLRGAQRPLVVAGTASGSEAILRAAAQVARALGRRGRIFLTLGECDSAGAALLGGPDAGAALQRVIDGEADTLVVMENDLYRRAPRARVDAALDAARHLIVIDHGAHATAERADAVLPAGSFAEADGTLVNNEGRAQRFFQVYVPHGTAIRESWRWCAALADETGWRGLDDVIAAIARDCPALAGIVDAAPGADFRLAGMRMPRAPHRYSGRTAMYANENVHERPPVPDPDSALAYSMEGFQGPRPGALMGFSWAPRWNSNQQSVAKFQDEVAGPLAGGDPGARLFESGRGTDYDAPPAPDGRPRWLAVARHHIFGSEPLSAAAPAIAERSPAPYVALHPDDAAELGAAEGETRRFAVDGVECELPVRLDPGLVRGCVGLPAGLEGLALPAEVTP